MHSVFLCEEPDSSSIWKNNIDCDNVQSTSHVLHMLADKAVKVIACSHWFTNVSSFSTLLSQLPALAHAKNLLQETIES